MIKKAQKVRKNLHNASMINENSRKKGKRVIFVKKKEKRKKKEKEEKKEKKGTLENLSFFGVCRL